MKPDPQKIKATISKLAINFGNVGIRSILTANLSTGKVQAALIPFVPIAVLKVHSTSKKKERDFSDVETFKMSGHSLRC